MISAKDIVTGVDTSYCWHCKNKLRGVCYAFYAFEVDRSGCRNQLNMAYTYPHSSVILSHNAMVSFCQECWTATAGKQYTFGENS